MIMTGIASLTDEDTGHDHRIKILSNERREVEGLNGTCDLRHNMRHGTWEISKRG